MTFEQWLHAGMANGWCGPILCIHHDGVPTTELEEELNDPCVPMIRLYQNEQEKLAVETNHSPSVWRQ